MGDHPQRLLLAHTDTSPLTTPPATESSQPRPDQEDTSTQSVDEFLLLDDEVEDRLSESWATTLVGFVLEGNRYRKQALTEGLVNAWNLKFGLEVSTIDQNHFLFQFQHRIDMENVLAEEPWTVAGNLIILESWNPEQRWQFCNASFWVQFYSSTLDLLDINLGRRYATQIGSPTKIMLIRGTQGGHRQHYLRARVKIDIRKPLRSIIPIRLRNGLENTIQQRTFFYLEQQKRWSCKQTSVFV
ncbi:uncharacterized protein LOC122078762 [Macadamia integrifolia]|uniref:uncharacterized protein LOC122078762 n=1 Tax=Macadamia integrifolia TaxID=60698 RepID=UPI001C4E6CC7|nr:uncharacterized protein LOC122078762 [Macadamia integrifolia]